MSKLPDKPSELIRMAIDDLEKVEADTKYSVRMGVWHSPSLDSCEVCLAGAVMAKTLETPVENFEYPTGFSATVHAKLGALDSFRSGHVIDAFVTLGYCDYDEVPGDILDVHKGVTVVSYEDDPEAFKVDMLVLANSLEGIGY